MKKEKIQAVHDEELENLLESLGLLGRLKAGNLRCNMCNRIITKENLQCIYPNNTQIGICCDSLECYEQLLVQKGLEDE